MSKDSPPASEPDVSYLVVTQDDGEFRRGMVLPNAPELADRLAGKVRPATPFDLGVAGIVTRKD